MLPVFSTLLLSTGWASAGAEFVVWRKEPLWRSVDRDEGAPDGGSLETLRLEMGRGEHESAAAVVIPRRDRTIRAGNRSRTAKR